MKTIWFSIISIVFFATISSCSNRITEENDDHGYHLECYRVKASTRDTLTMLYDKFRSALNENNDFLKGVTLVLVDKFAHLQGDHSFEQFLKCRSDVEEIKGVSFYLDHSLSKIIVMQEKASNRIDAMYYWTQEGRYTVVPCLRHFLMHEIGHQFDEFFGHDHHAKYVCDYDSVLLVMEDDPNRCPYSFKYYSQEEQAVIEFYKANNSLSDREEFKEAVFKDYIKLADKVLADSDDLPLDLNYYAKGIDFSSEITAEMVEEAEYTRAEVYAQLFSYAMGENDGDRRDFLNAFPNSFEVVKNDILSKGILFDGSR